MGFVHQRPHHRLAEGVGGKGSGSTWSPCYISYGGNNRSHLIRIPNVGRFECRMIDGAVNLYLATAGLLAAGLEGIQNQSIPPIVAIPTTAGTDSEVGRSTVLSDDETHAKKIMFDPRGTGRHAECVDDGGDRLPEAPRRHPLLRPRPLHGLRHPPPPGQRHHAACGMPLSFSL